MAGSAEALERFERQTAWLMLVLSLAIIPLLVIPLVADLSRATEATLFAIDWPLWAAFALEYAIQLYLAPAWSSPSSSAALRTATSTPCRTACGG